MSLPHALRYLASEIAGESPPVRLTFSLGTIATVTAGASLDGVAAVTVTVGGDTNPAPYAAAYTPVVGHMVAVIFANGAPLILCRVVGLPVI